MSGECGGVSSGGETPKLEAHRFTPTPFLTKTYQIVDDPSLDDLISWNEDGTGFVVWHTAEFARDLLPKYFKHNNFSSFIRQLNTYGFRKVVADRWEFANDYFKRGEKGMLREIQRRKINTGTAVTAAVAVAPVAAVNAQAVTIAVAPAVAFQISPADSGDEQVFSSNSSPAATAVTATHLPALRPCATMAEVLEENDRLRRENSQLRHDLDSLRKTFGHIFNLVSDYGSVPGEKMRREGKELDLLPAETQVSGGGERAAAADEMCPKIFGVSIGVKRARSEDHRTMIVRGPEAESEPLDRGSSSSQDTLNFGG